MPAHHVRDHCLAPTRPVDAPIYGDWRPTLPGGHERGFGLADLLTAAGVAREPMRR